MLPFQHIWTEALVCEASDGVGKGVLGGFEIDKVGLGCCMADWVVRGDFVRVLESGQPPEFGLYLFVVGTWAETEVLVEIPTLPHYVVRFIESVEKVNDNDCHVYAPSVFHISGSSGLRLWIASADGDAIIYGLEPACNELQVSTLVCMTLKHFICRHV